jgi:DNA topoisomerase-3
LPDLQRGATCQCERGEVLEKHTTPPPAFDDASLLRAMTGIARYVQDPELRKILKETDGLGTEATRAGIIELLFTRQFLQRKGKHIHSTPTGRGLIHSLPEIASRPDMTARWETELEAISQRRASYDGFIQPLLAALGELVIQSQAVLPEGLKNIDRPPDPGNKRRPRQSAKKAITSRGKKAGRPGRTN